MSTDGEQVPQRAEFQDLADTVGALASAVDSIKDTLTKLSEAKATTGTEETPKPPSTETKKTPPVTPVAPRGDAGTGEDSFTLQRDAGAYVPHGIYQHLLQRGFEHILPSVEEEDKPHILYFEDATTTELETKRMREALDEYRIVTSYGYFSACANAASEEALGQAIAQSATEVTPPWVRRLITALQEHLNTSLVIEGALRDRMSYIRRAKRSNATADDRIFNELLREQSFEPSTNHFGSKSHASLESTWRGEVLRQKILISAKETAKTKGKPTGKTEAERAAEKQKAAAAKKKLEEQKKAAADSRKTKTDA